MDEYKDEEKDEIVIMFKKLGKKKVKKLVLYLQQQVLSFKFDYDNIERVHLMNTLKIMRKPYMDMFDGEPMELLMFAPQ